MQPAYNPLKIIMPEILTQRQEKNSTIQLFRALAIIAVVIIHTTPEGVCQIVCRPFVNFSVAMFLFLSGYMTKAENTDWSTFFKKRIKRVAVPYIIWTVLYSLPDIFRHGVGCLFRNLITAQAAGPFYYILVYIQFVLLTPLLFRLARSRYRFIGWIITPASFLVFKYYCLFTGTALSPATFLIWGNSCLGWVTFYYLGLLLGNRIIENRVPLKKLSILYIASLILQMAEAWWWYRLGDSNYGTQSKMTSLVSSTLFLLIADNILKEGGIKFKSRFLQLTGDYSFGIYLCHIMVMTYIPHFYSIPYPLNSVVVLLLSLGLCILCDKLSGPKLGRWLGFR